MGFYIEKQSDIITSRSNPLLIKLCKLRDKKHRENEALFCLDGIKLLLEAAEYGADIIRYILVREDAISKVTSALNKSFEGREKRTNGTLVLLSESAFDKLSEEKSPEGVITVVDYLSERHRKMDVCNEGSFVGTEKTLMLESVRDPGNLGALMRSAAAFGVERIIMSADCADVYNPKALRAAMGAIFKVSTDKVKSLENAIKQLKKQGRRVFATTLAERSQRLGDIELGDTDVFIVGNEGHGLSCAVIDEAGESIYIPMCEGTESLNAAIAASVCMWEMRK